jgi:hypothetical protein
MTENDLCQPVTCRRSYGMWDGRLEMGDGRWEMGDWRWGIGDGGLEMGD